MEQFELLQRLAVALGVGLLIGIERGWVGRNEPEGERAFGLRSFAFSGLLGGVIAALVIAAPQAGSAMLASGFAVFALTVGFFRYREMLQDGTFGATTILAALLAFALGAFAVLVDKTLAAACGVAVAGLLALKAVLHDWLRRMTWPELRAGLVLLAMSVILLPVLPDRTVDPLKVLNPYQLWLMTILIAAVSAGGYLAIKLTGERRGTVLSAMAGGLVSSTAFTVTFARLAREHPERQSLFVSGILIAGATMLLRVLVVAGAFNAGLVRWLFLPLVLAALVVAAAAWLAQSRAMADKDTEPLALDNPFELATVLKFGAFLAVVMVVAKLVTAAAGNAGAYAVAAASGLADVDAITLTMAQLGGAELGRPVAAGAILVAVAVNTFAKAALAWSMGGRGPGGHLMLVSVAALVAGLLGVVLAIRFDVTNVLAPLLAG